MARFKSFISILISICTALLVLLLVMPIITGQPAADKAQSSLAKVKGIITTATTIRNAPENESAVTQKKFSIENIVDATNTQRIAAQLPPLKINTELNASAKIKVQDMITNQYFEHVSPAGKSVANLGDEVGYEYIIMGENLALGDFTDANDLLTAWMNSPGHRANIVNTHYQDIGVYAAQATYKGRTVWFAVQHFGTQRTTCPAIDEQLRTAINEQNAALKTQELQIAAMRTTIENADRPEGLEYQQLIIQFNDLVKNYNDALAISQQGISRYNTEVKIFNDCLAKYQKDK